MRSTAAEPGWTGPPRTSATTLRLLSPLPPGTKKAPDVAGGAFS